MRNEECRLRSATRQGPCRGRVALFCLLTFAICISAAGDTPLNPDDPAYLRRQHAWFRTQPPHRQEQLRKLHGEFLDLDERDQSRLTRVMQAYNAWLAKLPPADRE